MKSFRLVVSSPDGKLFDEECVKFDARGTEGEFSVMAGHIPFVTFVLAGTCTITSPDESVKKAECEGGLLTVNGQGVNLLSGSFRIN